jgi:hypothetical protein
VTYQKADNDPRQLRSCEVNNILDTDALSGHTSVVTFTPTKVGTFKFVSGEGDDEKNGMVGSFVVVAVARLALGGCANVEDRPGAATTAARAAATAVHTRAAFTVGVVSTPTPARTRTPQPRDEADAEQWIANARAMVEKALASPTLPAIEDLLLETVALAGQPGGGTS